MTRHAGPWEQSLHLTFRVLWIATLLAGAAWLFSNVRAVGSDSRAVVLRFGAIERVGTPGLLLAWPRPIERVVTVPSPERVLEHNVVGLERAMPAKRDDQAGVALKRMGDTLAGSGYLLTGDLGVVHLSATVFYRVTDPAAYVREGPHVLPALDRIVTASALHLSASRDLDTILVTRAQATGVPGAAGSTARASDDAVQRERLRAELVQAANDGLARLAQRGASLGVSVTRIDLVSSLPQAAVTAFNAVLTASQQADRNIADARTEAAMIHQHADASVDSLLGNARAQASERVARAQAETDEILALAPQQKTDPELALRLYRQRIQAVLAKAGEVTLVNPHSSGRLIVPGASQ